ncbi:MAG: extracellular solute-binding protein [Candidatus Cohnella colombiensis]|uniref:Extracellular solute-binding protein n=1 Tax=Candidatus Cohnella colombiensis TaxID=3121368 RepID=A0AA95EZV4_9BACL|nr:MAG: extracellular solute-binding protein [Cohnella sp.]
MRYRMSIILLIACLMILLSSCKAVNGQNVEQALKPLDNNEKVSITIMFWDSTFFNMKYGDKFQESFPNIDFKVINMAELTDNVQSPRNDTYDQFIAKYKPDVLMLPDDQFRRFAKEGKLYGLDSVIEQDQFPVARLNPTLLRMLLNAGNGKVYGLAPDFTSSALFYNIDLFNKYHISLPQDGMSWDEVFELAKKFPTDGEADQRDYGFVPIMFTDLFNFITSIAKVQGAQYVEDGSTQLSLNSREWVNTASFVIDAIHSGAMRMYSDEERFTDDLFSRYMSNLFINGRAAMSFAPYYSVQELSQARQSIQNLSSFQWAVVTAPVASGNRSQSAYNMLGMTYAILDESQSKRAAWEVIKFINSEQYAKDNPESMYGNLSAWSDATFKQDGVSMEPFFKLEPFETNMGNVINLPPIFFDQLSFVASMELKRVIDYEMTAQEAMESIQKKGQVQLDELLRAASETVTQN